MRNWLTDLLIVTDWLLYMTDYMCAAMYISMPVQAPSDFPEVSDFLVDLGIASISARYIILRYIMRK